MGLFSRKKTDPPADHDRADDASHASRPGAGPGSERERKGVKGGAITRGADDARRDEAPTSPRKLPKGSIMAALKRTPKEFSADGMTDVAAALTYYSVLSLFPGIIALVSILSLVGDSAISPIQDSIDSAAPGAAKEILNGALKGVSSSGGVLPFIIGIAAALWSASGYVGAFGRASNTIFEVEEGRPFWKLRPLQLIVTLLMMLLISASVIALVVSGPIAEEVGNVIGLGSESVKLWDLVKIPGILLAMSATIAILMYFSPNVKLAGFSWVLIGGIIALLTWIIATALVAFYFANFANYNKTYGTLGGVIAFLFWLWVSNLALLFGQEFNAEIERQRELEVGLISGDDELMMPELRQEPKDKG